MQNINFQNLWEACKAANLELESWDFSEKLFAEHKTGENFQKVQ